MTIMKQSVIIGSLLLVCGACAPDTKPTNRQTTDYIINEPDFEELERIKAERLGYATPGNKNQAPKLSFEDSIEQYLKKMTHDFRLQEKQYKALSYIYTKYRPKEAQAIANNDTATLAEYKREKERSIEVVLGEQLYAKKAGFDEQYVNQMPTSEEIETLPIYFRKLTADLGLSLKQINEVHRINRNFNKKLAKNRNNIAATKALKEQNAKNLKIALGDSLYNKKILFDKVYYQK